MTDISSNDLKAHYTTQAKVEKPIYKVASAPKKLPSYHAFDDNDANKKLGIISKDIYKGTKEEKGNAPKKFWKVYLSFVLAVLGFVGIRKLFK